MLTFENGTVRACAFIGLSLLIAAPVFVHPGYLGIQDWDQNLFRLEAARVSIVEYGQFPLWNPWEGGGFPLLGHPESRFLFPTFLLTLLFGPVLGVKLELVMHYALGLWGMFELGRHLRLGERGAMVASCLYMLSGMCALSFASGMSVFMSAAFIPWAFLFLQNAEHRMTRAALAGGSLSLMFLDGGVVFTAMTLFFLAVHSCVQAAYRPREAKQILGALGLTCVWAFALGAVKLLPTLEVMTRVPRHIDEFSGYSVGALWHALTDRDQTLMTALEGGTSFWEGATYAIDENGMYVGVLGVVLMGLGVVALFRRSPPLALSTLLFLWLSFGDRAPLAGWPVLHQLPIFGSMRVAQRFRFEWMLGAALAGGLGAEIAGRRLTSAVRSKVGPTLTAVASFAILSVLAADLIIVNSKPFREAFSVPPPPIPARGPFRQIRELPGYDKRGYLGAGQNPGWASAWSGMYPGVLANLGTLAVTGPIAPEPAAMASDTAEYAGEVTIEGTEGKATLVDFSPNRLQVEVNTPAAGVLVANQNFDTAWRVMEGEVVSRRGLISVPVQGGEHLVDLYYLPTSFLVGATVSVGATALALVLLLRLRNVGAAS